MGTVFLAFLGTLIILGMLAALLRRSQRRTLHRRARVGERHRQEILEVTGRIRLAQRDQGVTLDAASIDEIAASAGPRASSGDSKYASEYRRRIEIADSGSASIPLVPPSAPQLAGAQLGVPEGGPFPGARFVKTPDGEAMITKPPFRARGSLFSRKHAAYAHLLLTKLPAWVVLCPKTRMDAIVSPTPPDGRDAEDWRTWRRRVRWRAVDLLLCDRRTWRPLLAIIFDTPPGGGVYDAPDSEKSRVRMVAGGRDRIIDEVLHAAGVPLVRATGNFASDWAAIEPYVSEAILRSGIVDETFDRELAELEQMRQLGDSAVDLLAIEGDDGFLLK